MLHLYSEGEFVRSKEARTKKEFDQMILNGYIEEPKPTEYPKMLYKSVSGSLKNRTVSDKNEEAEAKKAGFMELHKMTTPKNDDDATPDAARKGRAKTVPE
jgi:hypothetical protein